MNSAFGFVVFGLHLSVGQVGACASPYGIINGGCLHLSSVDMQFCEAQVYCLVIGGELVYGDSFLPLDGYRIDGKDNNYWIGLTDLADERSNSRSGWRWTDGSVIPQSSGLQWFEGQPTGAQNDCAQKCGPLLCVNSCRKAYALRKAMCQPRAKKTSPVRGARFEPVSVPTGLSGAAFAGDGGCSQMRKGAASKVKCAALCSSHSNDWCVSFYFNKEKKECYLVLYTEAMVDVGHVASWVKFRRRK